MIYHQSNIENADITIFKHANKTLRRIYRSYGVYVVVAAVLFFIAPKVFAQASSTDSVLQVISSQSLETATSQVLLKIDIAQPDKSKALRDDINYPDIQRAAKLLKNGDFVIYASPDGHYYVPATINGFPVLLMVDSGADVSLVSESLALKTGISQLIKLANGQTIDYKKSANIIKIGNRYISNAHVLAIDQLETPRLGADALNTLDISFFKGVMTIKPIDGVIKSNALTKN